MRQVNRDELQYVLASAMRRVRPALRKQLIDPRRDHAQRAEALIGGIMADALSSLEILSTAPAASDSTFSRPIARMLGEEVGSGAAPTLDDIPY